jgi:hypothetical protein
VTIDVVSAQLMANYPLSCDELAAELGINPRILRAWLRKTHPRAEEDAATRRPWHISPALARTARARFSRR